MLQQILETYACIISHRKTLPGASIEDIFPDGFNDLEVERDWIIANVREIDLQARLKKIDSKKDLIGDGV